MKLLNYIFTGILLLVCNFSFSQIVGNGASTTESTAYTNGATNDVIYIYCVEPGTSPNIGSLTANAASGTGPWDFEWYQYNPATNSYDDYDSQNNVASGSHTIDNLPSGGYSVSIIDNGGNIVGCYRTWVFCNETNLDAGNIAATCGGFNLNGTVDPVADFVYYNPPPDKFIIDANTEITVCFDATHTYVSDLAFYLISPNGNIVDLALHPQAIDAANGCCCNSSNNVSNFCISTESNNDLDVCNGMNGISGTYGSYGGNNVDWSTIYGEDAAQGGWTVQIFDCIGGDVGALTNASISFVGNSVCGPESIDYDSGNINSAINDNSCSSGTASSFVVDPDPQFTTPITLTNSIVSFEWTTDGAGCTSVPNATTSLNPAIASTPTEDTWFYLTAIDNFDCEFTDSVQFIRDCPCPTNSPFNYIGANIGNIDCGTGTFDIIDGELIFDEGIAPCTGTLTISNCSGDNVTFNAPFTSPINFTIEDIVADGTPNCTLIAEFSDDPEACTIETNTYTEPDCPCNIDDVDITIGSCVPATNNYMMSGTIEFTNPPATGTLTITVTANDGTTYDRIINPADYVVSPATMDWSISGIDSDGLAASIIFEFTADGTCVAGPFNYTAPEFCACNADIGTFVTSDDNATNTDFILCFGDTFTYESNGDYTPPTDINHGTIPYNPGIGYLIYSCPPTPGMTPDVGNAMSDPCVEGLVLDGTGALAYNDLNDLGWINAYPPGTFPDNIIYYVPVTMYDITGNWYSVAIDPCYELGPAVAVQYLPEIKALNAEDCQAGTITTTLTGGQPEIDGSNFTVVPGSLTPANASFDNTTATHNGTITISGLENGDNFSYNVVDGNNCPVTVSGTFIGTEDPGFNYSTYTVCQADTDPTVTITGDAGSFAFTVTSGGPTLSLNGTTGAIDASASDPGVYEVTYTTNDATCFSDSTVTITINETPTVNPVTDQTECAGTDFTAITFSGTGSPTFNWTNDNTAIGLGAGASGNIAAFTATNNTAADITGTITVTPSTATCTGTATTFDLTVNPLDNPGFEYPAYTYCTSETDPAATIDVAGGTFSYVATPGTSVLSLNTTTGLIDLSATDAGDYDITYTTNGTCPQDSTITMSIAATPTVDPITDQTVCADADFALIDFTGSAGTTFNWTNDNTAIGLAAGGTNDIAAFTATNNTVAQISATITVTPVAGSCTGTQETFDLIVNPLGNPGFSYPAYNFCTSETDPTATIDVAGGTFSYVATPGTSVLSINTSTGAIDLSASDAGDYDITYTTVGPCPQDSTITMSIAATPSVDPITDQTVCADADFALIDFTGSAGSTFNWTNDNTAIGLAANGTNDIAAFTATNNTTAQISATITVTPVAGSCTGTQETFDLIVNPLDNPGFDYGTFAYCQNGTDPAPSIDVAGGNFTYVATTGGPTLTINGTSGLIDLDNSDPGVYDITYTTTGVCVQDSTQTVTINMTPTVDAITDQTVCAGSDFNTVTITGSANTTFNWTNDNTAIGLAANNAGDITAFTGTNNTAAQISGTIEVTPSTATCTGTPITFDLIVNPLDNPGFEYATYSFCSSETDPTPTIDVLGGVFSFTANSGGPNLSINTANGTIDLSASDPGIYDITYTTTGLCVQDSTVTLSVAATPSVNPITDQTICHNDDFAFINFTGSAGSVFNWVNDDTSIGLAANGTDDIAIFTGTNTSAAPVTANITVTPVAGSCTGTDETFTLTVNPLDDPGFNYTITEFCTTDADPTPSIDVVGGTFSAFTTTGTNTLVIDGATGTIDIDASGAGVYDVTYTTVGPDCPQDSVITITINQTPIVNTIPDQTVCEDDQFNSINFTGTPGSTFDWINDNTNIGLAANGNGQIVTFTGETNGGVETATITVTPSTATCTGSDSTFILTVNPLDNPGFSYPQYSYCTTDTDPSPTIDAAGGGFTYVVNNGGPTLVIDGTTGQIDLDASDEGEYEITYLTTGVCPQDSTITMTINFTPTIDPITDETVCHGTDFTAINFTGTGATDYDWTNTNSNIGLAADGSGNITAFAGTNTGAGTISGTITVTPSTQFCTGTTTDFVLTVNPLDDPSFDYGAGGLTYCSTALNEPQANITGLTGGTFSYAVISGGPTLDLNTTTGDITLASSDVGEYDITYTTNGNCPQTSTVTLTITDAPVANFSFGEYCNNEDNQLPDFDNDLDNNPITAFATSGTGGTFSATPVGLSINAGTGEVDIAASTPGTYMVTNEINIPGCAQASDQDDIVILPMPTATITGGETICIGDPNPEIIVTGTGTGSNFTVTYTFNGANQAPILSATSPITLPDLGVGEYEVIGIHDGMCTSTVSETTTIDEHPLPTIEPITNQDICEGSMLNPEDFVGLPNPGVDFIWNIASGTDIGFGTTGIGQIADFTALNPNAPTTVVTVNVVPVTPGNTSTNSPNGCVGNPESFDITVNPLPIVDFTSDAVAGCTPTTITFTDNSLYGQSYEWTFGNGATGSGQTVSYTYENAGTYDIGLTVTSDEGCIDSSLSVAYINITPTPVAAFAYTPDITDVLNTEVEYTNNSIDGDYYEWNFGDDSGISNEENPTHEYPELESQYEITLLVTNNNGLCRDSTNAFVTINDLLVYYVPNVFTPDQDEFNETFGPVFTSGYDPYDYHLTIFNRWGEIIFESYDATVGWDGTYPNGGELCQDGVYVWRIEFKETKSDKRIVEQGHVTLLK